MKLDPTPGYAIKTKELSTGTKVFINVCTDPQVPAPPVVDATVIARLIQQGEDWSVPIVVSNPPRNDTDKNGGPCYVWDCCMNPKVLLLGVSESLVKDLTIETCLELVEDASGTMMDRNYKLPRLKAKGILSRTEIANSDFNANHPKPLEEVLSQATKQTKNDTIAPLPEQTNGKVINKSVDRKPIVEELGSQTSFYLHPFRSNCHGNEGPAYVLELSFKPTWIYRQQNNIIWDGGRTKLAFVPSKEEGFWVANEETFFLYLWK